MSHFTLNRNQIITALTRMGELAGTEGVLLELGVVGGSIMVLEYASRETTRDLDTLVLPLGQNAKVFEFAKIVAAEQRWPESWLNNQVSSVIYKLDGPHVVFNAPGIKVYAPSNAFSYSPRTRGLLRSVREVNLKRSSFTSRDGEATSCGASAVATLMTSLASACPKV